MLSVAFSPDGKRLACGVMDGTVALFDVPSGQLMHTLTGHHKPVRDVCFTPGLFICCCVYLLPMALMQQRCFALSQALNMGYTQPGTMHMRKQSSWGSFISL